MTRRNVLGLMLAVLVGTAGMAAAHEGHSHKTHKMMGTVKAVHADMNHVEITTKAGKTDGFYVDSQTKYLKGKDSSTLSALTPGTRVVADVKTEGGKMIATRVRISSATQGAKAAHHRH